MATDPTGRISHIQDMHRGLTWKPACRVATTANITISTALNNADTLDGVTLATGDRVLVKDQSTASQNGIYIVGATPTRAADMDQDGTTAVPAEEIAGAVVFVISGTVNTKTIWYTTNAVGGTVGSTSIVWTQFAASSLTVKDEGSNLDTAVSSIDFVGSGVVATNSGHAVTVTIGGGSGEDDWLIDINPYAAHSNTNFDSLTNSLADRIGAGEMESTGAQNAERNWNVGITGSGTWTIQLLHFKASNRGIYSVQIDDVEVGTIDGYSSGSSANVRSTVTSVSISSGKRKVSLKMLTKNASSSSYFGTFSGLVLLRTA